MLFKNYIALILILLYHSSFSQETPYFLIPKTKVEPQEKPNLTNLKPFGIQYYAALYGGFNKAQSKDISSDLYPLGSRQVMHTNWGVDLGVNRNDNYFFEIGFSQVPYNTVSIFKNLYYGYSNIYIDNPIKYYAIPFRVKKRVLTIDKNAQKAFILVGAGAAYQFRTQGLTHDTLSVDFIQRQSPASSDLKSMYVDLFSHKKNVYFELFSELRGIVHERFEITVFVKSLINIKPNVMNSYSLKLNDNSVVNMSNTLKSTQFLFGLKMQYNSPKYVKYLD